MRRAVVGVLTVAAAALGAACGSSRKEAESRDASALDATADGRAADSSSGGRDASRGRGSDAAGDAGVLAESGSLVVGAGSHVVVLEYETLYGPAAVNVVGCEVYPTLISADMVDAGFVPPGYDSADPAVLRDHLGRFKTLGVDAVTLDVSNDAVCTYDTYPIAVDGGGARGCPPAFRTGLQAIRANAANVYGALASLPSPPPVRLIPLLDGSDRDLLAIDATGETALEHEVEYFGALVDAHPELDVVYLGHPLLVLFVGPTPCVKGLADCGPPWLDDVMAKLESLGLTSRYTFRVMGGYFDAQPEFWAKGPPPDGPVQLAATDPYGPYWTWVDRLKPSYGYYPSYGVHGGRVESFTASVATAGAHGWASDAGPRVYAADDALRGAGQTFAAFMAYARELDPLFLWIHQFNEYSPAVAGQDEGWDRNTTDGIEETNAVPEAGYIDFVAAQLAAYHAAVADGGRD